MPTAKEYKDQIQRMDDYARRLAFSLEDKDEEGKPNADGALNRETEWMLGYPLWYAQAYEVVKFLLPDHLEEFERLYLADPKRREINAVNYTIQDWLLCRRPSALSPFDEVNVIKWKFLAQMQMLVACRLKLDSVVMNFKKLTLADLFDSELDGAKELLKAGFVRPAGVIARVVLEKHLKDVCETHKVGVTKKRKNKPPDLSDYNDSLKEAGIYDTTRWRKIQVLGDITNKCCHDKDPEPTEEEVRDLIDGAEKTIKTVF